MKIKKLIFSVLTFAVCMVFATSALAAPGAGNIINIAEGYLTVTIPEGYYVLTQDMDESYEFFQDFEADIDVMKDYLVEQRIYLDLYAKDMSHEIIIMVQTPAEAGLSEDEAFDYDEIPDEYRKLMLEGMMESTPSVQGYSITFTEVEFTDVNNTAWIRGSADMTDGNGTVSDRIQYSTCQNGMILNVNLFSTDGSSAASFQSELDALMEEIEIGTRQGYTPPAVPTASTGGGVLPKVLICAVVAAIIGVIIGAIVSASKKKKAKKAAEEAARTATAQGFGSQNYYEDMPTQQYPDQE